MIHIKDGKRFNPQSLKGKRAPDGSLRTNYPNAQDLIELGVTQIDEPQPPVDYHPDTHDRFEIDDAPYVLFSRKSDEQIAEIAMQKAKQQRQEQVDAIIVTTASGKQFDGNEEAQGRMTRAIAALDPGETTLWILADNTPDPLVTREELREALRLAGAAQTAVWVTPYQ